MSYWPVLVFGVTALAWVLYFRWKDAHRPEPWLLTLLCLAGGAMSALLSLAGYEGLALLGAGTDWEQLSEGTFAESVLAALRIGAVEEVAKLLPVAVLALKRREFDELLDGIVYAAFASIGFAAAESVILWLNGLTDLASLMSRGLAAPLSHALFAAPAGLGLALTALRKRPGALAAGLTASIVLHGLYNWMLARPELPSFLSAGVVAILWLWVLRITPKLSRRKREA